MIPRFLRSLPSRVLPPRLRPTNLVGSRLLRASGGKVMQGPFRGLTIVVDPATTDWPKLLGTYELELHPVIERVAAAPPAAVVNVGAAEGYYAVGLAVRCPAARVVAFEERAEMRDHVTRVAAANGVAARVEVRGLCGEAELAGVLAESPGSLLVVDIEGGEVDLLDPARVQGLAACSLLVEEHDVMRPGCSRTLLDRFAATHHAEVIRERPRRDSDLPVRWPLARRWLRRMMGEGRPGPQSWLYLVPAVRKG